MFLLKAEFKLGGSFFKTWGNKKPQCSRSNTSKILRMSKEAYSKASQEGKRVSSGDFETRFPQANSRISCERYKRRLESDIKAYIPNTNEVDP